MDRTEQLGKDPILKLIIRFSIPSIVAMFVQALYSIVDRAFLSRFVGEDALAAITLTFPILMALFSLGALVGIGGSVMISIRFGEQKQDEAQHIFGNIIVLVVSCSILLSIIIRIFLVNILSSLGATGNILNLSVTYMSIILPGIILQLSSFSLAALVRSEGRPKLSMWSQLISAIANIVLDFIFIVVLNMSVTGAAIATIMSQFIGFAILFSHFFLSGKSILKFNFKYLRLNTSIIRQVVAVGLPNFIMTLGGSITFAILLKSIYAYGNDSDIASMGVINSLYTLLLMPILGLQQGVSPIIGYNHGMKQKERVSEALYKGIGIGCIFSVLVTIALQVSPATFASLFISRESPTIVGTIKAIHIYFIMLTFLPINVLGTGYFQATAQSKKAFLLSVSRQGLFLIPALIILPIFFGLNGVWMATPVSDFISIFLTVIFLILENRKNFAKKEVPVLNNEEG